MSIQIGSYVDFQGVTYVVVKHNANETIQILNPLSEGVDSKKSVNRLNLEVLPYAPMKVISYKGTDYLVSIRGLIISLRSNKVMRWDSDHGNRKAILGLAASS